MFLSYLKFSFCWILSYVSKDCSKFFGPDSSTHFLCQQYQKARQVILSKYNFLSTQLPSF